MREPAADDRLGPYRLLHELGRGGQAIVWLAEDTRIGRRVALKLLPALGPGSASLLRRFRREAEVTSRLDHPAICPVYEAELEGPVPFIAMRFVDGETLAQRIARTVAGGGGPVVLSGEQWTAPDWPAIAAFFAKAARALHLAHEAAVVHRDVKPQNVMVTREGEPVVLDFGLARQDDPDSHSRSLSGDHSGTPAYMSPEQLHGRAPPDRRSDVYGLGCTLFEALTGRPAFQAATLEGLFHAVLQQDVPDARSVHAGVPEDLAVIAATAAAKERERRYQTALLLAEDLERFLRSEPILARPLSKRQRLQRWCRRNPALAGSLAAIAVLLLLATGLLSYGVGAAGRAEIEEQQRIRIEQAQAAQAQANADRDLAGRLDELQMQLGTLIYGMGADPAMAASLRPAFDAVMREAGVQLDRADAVAAGIAHVRALRARNASAGRSLLSCLRNFAWLQQRDATARERIRALLAAFQEPREQELAATRARWEKEKVDEFAPWLTPEALAPLDSEQLVELAGDMVGVEGREATVYELIDRSLLLAPDSFSVHYMRAGLGLQAAVRSGLGPESAPHVQRAVEHLRAAMALRPRSGLVRATLSGALALQTLLGGDRAGFVAARAMLDSATEVEPRNPLVWYFRADYLNRSPDGKPQAIAACRQALELDRGFAPARRLLDQLEK